MITPCPKCRKRHGRDHDHGYSGAHSNPSTVSPVPNSIRCAARAFVLLTSLLEAVAVAPSPSDVVSPLTGGIVDVSRLDAGGARRTGEDHEHKDVIAEIEGNEDHAHDEHHKGEDELNIFEPDLLDEDHEGGMPSEHHSEHGQDKHHDENSYDAHSEATFLNTDSSKPWGSVILATILVNLATLSGLVLLIVPTIRQGVLTKASSELKGHGKLIDIVIPSFAVGALMATAVFLVLPEALHLIEGSHGQGGDDHSGHGHRFLQDEHEGNGDNEGVVFAKWGCGILGGFLLPAFLSLFCHGQSVHEDDGSVDSDGEDCKSCMEKDCGFVGSDNSVSVDDADEEAASVPEAPALMSDHQVVIGEVNEAISVQIKSLINYRLAIAVLVGDIFCNLADGIFIGAAFLGCSSATAISITLIALVHEVPQELADFVILTRYAGLSATTAFILNFVTGLSVCVGGLIVFASKPTDEAVGLVLAIAGGVYLSLAASESMPRVARYTESTSDKALSLFLTVLGTIPLGLVLLNHQHC